MAQTSASEERFAGWRRVAARLRSAHRDERGVISIAAVFVLFMFTILLIMLVNTATHLDDKIKMQNAADAGGYSGGVILARGMNTLAFTNHLLSDTFAITAFLREGRDRQAEQLTPEILDEWEKLAQKFSAADFDKFKQLGDAMLDKVARDSNGKDRELIEAFGEMTAKSSEFALPVFEYVLSGSEGSGSAGGGAAADPEGGLIPRFQRIVIQTLPEVAQTATSNVAQRHGIKSTGVASSGNPQDSPRIPRDPPRTGSRLPQRATRNDMVGVLWRTNALPVGYPDESDPMLRTLPAVDPSPLAEDFAMLPNGSQYFETARLERDEYARHYLEIWTQDKLQLFARDVQMARFEHLWRIFTCAHLDKLLDEYPATNLPTMIRYTEAGVDMDGLLRTDRTGEYVNQHLENDFNFLSLAYRQHLIESGPGLFKNPINRESDALAFAQVSLFLPRSRHRLGRGGGPQRVGLGGSFGVDTGFEVEDTTSPPPTNIDPEDEVWVPEGYPRHWDLWNQNWTVKLVPATATQLPDVLQAGFGSDSPYRPPNLGNARIEDINRINTH